MMHTWRGLPPNLLGSAYAFIAFVYMTVFAIFVKLLATRIPVIEILFVRQFVGTLILVAVFRRDLPALVLTAHPKRHAARSVVTVFGIVLGFYSLAFLPLADSNAIGFAEVLFTTVGAVIWLKESVGIRRWIATAVGFGGVLLMLSPFGSGVSIYTLFAVVAPLFGAIAAIMVRSMPTSESAERILFWQTASTMAVFAPFAWYFWVPMSGTELFYGILVGVLATLSQWYFTRAFQIGEASALAPMHFTRLIMAAATGWLVFSEIPSLATMIGAVLVVGATVYTLKRNAVRNVPVIEALAPVNRP